jgi:hypothetical protein
VRFISPSFSILSTVHSCWLQIANRLGSIKFRPHPPLQVSSQNLIFLPFPKVYFNPSSLIARSPFQN